MYGNNSAELNILSCRRAIYSLQFILSSGVARFGLKESMHSHATIFFSSFIHRSACKMEKCTIIHTCGINYIEDDNSNGKLLVELCSALNFII